MTFCRNYKKRRGVVHTLLSLIGVSQAARVRSPYASGLNDEMTEGPLTDADADFEQIVVGLPTRLRAFAQEYYYFGMRHGLTMPDVPRSEIYRVMDLVDEYRGSTRRTQALLGA